MSTSIKNKVTIETHLTEEQIYKAIDQYLYRRDFMKKRNQKEEVKEQRRQYNQKRYALVKEAMKLIQAKK